MIFLLCRSVSQSEVNQFYKIATEIQQRQALIQDTLIEAGVYDKSPSEKHFATQPVPSKILQEVHDADRTELLRRKALIVICFFCY